MIVILEWTIPLRTCGDESHYSPRIVPVGQQKRPVLFSILPLHPSLQDLKEPLEAPRGLGPGPLPLHPFVGLVQFCHRLVYPELRLFLEPRESS